MKRLLAVFGLAAVLTLGFGGAGCGKTGTKVSPQVRQSIEKGATMKELRERGPKPPNKSLKPAGVQGPQSGPPGGGQGQQQGGPGGVRGAPQGGL